MNSNAPQVIDGPLGDVREQLNALPDVGLHAHVVLWNEEPLITEAPFPAIDAQNAAAIEYLLERLKNAPTDPEEIRRAEAELEELHQNLNRNRIEAGEYPLFPE